MLSQALRSIRVFHDLNQVEAGKRLGISRSYLSEIESGTKEPTLQLIQRYAESFGLPASSILFFSENLGKPGAHQDARRFVASKILALMRFLEERSTDGEHVD
jgi:transcriptional regulator with XRE-family HTH domain